MADRVVLTIGTRKGVCVAEAAKPRRRFALRGPFGPGTPVYSTLIDTRGTPRLYASSCSPFFGMKVLRSTDMGKTFKETKSAPAFPKDDGRALVNIWSLEAGGGKKDRKELLCGVEPASLFRSHDAGDSWEMVPGISNHEHARKWQPGAGGLCMHTIIRDGNRVHLGISTGGHYLSEDGGDTFTEIVDVKPSVFGFAVAAHPKIPDIAWFVPAIKDERRVAVDGRLVVNRTSDGGKTFEQLGSGLPEKDCFDLIYRHGLDVDATGETLAMGSTTGNLWVGRGGGKRWTLVSAHLPPIAQVAFA